MGKPNLDFTKIENEFLANQINIDKVGFYKDSNFIKIELEKRIEQEKPYYLEHYAKYVQLKNYDKDYLKRVRVKFPIIATLLHRELVADGRKGACVDIALTLSLILEEEGIWNYIVYGSLTIDFPKGSERLETHFHSVDIGNTESTEKKIRAAHAWVVVPPYSIVDLTVKQQRYSQGEEKHLPDMILSEIRKKYHPKDRDLISEERLKIWANKGIRADKAIRHQIPEFDEFNKFFKAISVSYNGTKLHYIPTSVAATDTPFSEATNLKLSGRYGYEIYQTIIRPALRQE